MDHDLLNTDNYVRTVAPLISNPAVQNAVATDLTNQLWAKVDVQQQLAGVLPSWAQGFSGPLSNQLKTYAYQAIHAIVSSPQFAKVWEVANRQAHAQGHRRAAGQQGPPDRAPPRRGEHRSRASPRQGQGGPRRQGHPRARQRGRHAGQRDVRAVPLGDPGQGAEDREFLPQALGRVAAAADRRLGRRDRRLVATPPHRAAARLPARPGHGRDADRLPPRARRLPERDRQPPAAAPRRLRHLRHARWSACSTRRAPCSSSASWSGSARSSPARPAGRSRCAARCPALPERGHARRAEGPRPGPGRLVGGSPPSRAADRGPAGCRRGAGLLGHAGDRRRRLDRRRVCWSTWRSSSSSAG